jgi:hypothetical protein
MDERNHPVQIPTNSLRSAGREISGTKPTVLQNSPPITEVQTSYETSPQQIQFYIERQLAVDLPSRIRPCQDAIDSLSSKIDSISNSIQISLGGIREKISEFSSNASSLSDTVADNRERTEYLVTSLQRDTAQLKDLSQTSVARIQTLESRCAQLEESVRTISQRQSQFEDFAAEQVSKLNANVSLLNRQSIESDRAVLNPVELFNRATQDTFAHFGSQIQALSSVANDGVSELARSTRTALELLRTEHDSDIERIDRQIESSTIETTAAVNQIETDMVGTFRSVIGILGAMENAIITGAGNGQRNEQRMVDGYNVFTVAIADQMAGTAQSVNRIEASVKSHVESVCQSFLSAWKADLNSFLKDVSATVGDCQARTSGIEEKLADYIASVGKRQDEIMKLVMDRVEVLPVPPMPVQPAPPPETAQTAPQALPKVVSARNSGQRNSQFRPPQVRKPGSALSPQSPPPAPAPADTEELEVGASESQSVAPQTPEPSTREKGAVAIVATAEEPEQVEELGPDLTGLLGEAEPSMTECAILEVAMPKHVRTGVRRTARRT